MYLFLYTKNVWLVSRNFKLFRGGEIVGEPLCRRLVWNYSHWGPFETSLHAKQGLLW